MVSPFSDRAESSSSGHRHLLSYFPADWADRLNAEQMFILIDGVLPFEACLYHQILPLFLEGSRLNLGMVSPDDTAALDYARRIVSYMNYSLVSRPLSSEALQAVLSAYLQQGGSRQSLPKFKTPKPTRGAARKRHSPSIDRQLQQTLVVDSPEELTLHSMTPQGIATPPPEIPFQPAPVRREESIPQAFDSEQSSFPSIEPDEPTAPPTIPPSVISPLPLLEVEANYLSSPIEQLAMLPPATLLRELMARVLLGGIGRLYFERQPQYGRVLWSQNGVLQSVLDRLDADQFQGIISELKQMCHLSLIAVKHPKQVEIERMHQNTRLLLRFRFMPSVNGEEEATLQVLRGAALRFYQQQQLSSLERDALTIAKQLQLKVNEIRDRARLEPGTARSKFDSLPALNQMLRHMEEQIEHLQSESPSP
ncbi:hypothetical protein H6F67_12030 [Microcoleus sp. FACHB-1515]|uniref:ATPase, T2SS/T4P/T4SS family n=1 Tax=Cyanophyceae TaxID=3028117 RepID=UPI001687518D|nr:hypothetical protein [Microcoleus sp. FACHB-1515]MBD2090583.1 hypothetical protein [Microcoleus sp. FACHB-1515]